MHEGVCGGHFAPLVTAHRDGVTHYSYGEGYQSWFLLAYPVERCLRNDQKMLPLPEMIRKDEEGCYAA